MKRESIWLMVLCMVSSNILAQKKFEDLKVYGAIGVNHSYLVYNRKDAYKRYSLEFWVSGILEKSVSKNFALRSGLRLGLKPKTNYMYSVNSSTYIVDKTYNTSNHYYIEMPIQVVYQWKHFSIGTGILGRQYFNFDNTSGEEDFLKGRYETGVNTFLWYELFPDVHVGLNSYFGLTEIFSSTYYSASTVPGMLPQSNSIKARNNFIGFNISYKIK